jgi:hypothetical protein
LSHYWVVKIKADGTKEWDKVFVGNQDAILTSMVKTPDGGYILGGHTASGIAGDKTTASKGSSDYWIVKLNQDGKKVWDRTYGGRSWDFLSTLISTPDGGYLLGGSSWSGAGEDKTAASRGYEDYWIIKVDTIGNKEWDKTFGGNGTDLLTSLVAAPGGGYLLGGHSTSGAGGDKSNPSLEDTDYWIVKVNADGSKAWDKTLGGSGEDRLTAMVLLADGNYLLGGSSDSGTGGFKSAPKKGAQDYWIVKVNANGNQIWDKTYGGHSSDYLSSMITTADGGFLLGGDSGSEGDTDKSEARRGLSWDDYWVVKLKADGTKEWDKTFGGSGWDRLTSLLETANGSFLLGGYSYSGANGDKTQNTLGWDDFWVVKFKSNQAGAVRPEAPKVTGMDRCGPGPVTLTATGGTDGNYRWYTAATGDTPVANVTEATYTTPYLTTTTTYYVSIVNGMGGESTRVAVTVTIKPQTPAPLATSLVTYCLGAPASALTAAGENLKWYTTAIRGSALTGAPVPNTSSIGNVTYYVSQTVNDCESDRASVQVIIEKSLAAPTATGAISCGPGAVILKSTGGTVGNYRWYTTAIGGTAIGGATSDIYATPTLTATFTYYVSIVSGSCESERTAVTATVNNLPAAPTIPSSEVIICQNAPPTALTATGSNLKWYSTDTDGTGSITAPTPSTASARTTDYFVSQTVNGCESTRSKIKVTVTAAPEISFAPFPNKVCSSNTNFVLIGGLPAGGTYSGPGVSNGNFNAVNAGIGTHLLSYTYTANGCTAMATQNITVDTCTGIEESEISSATVIYPNPATDKVMVKVPFIGPNTVIVKIMDAQGKVVVEQNYKNVLGEFKEIFNLKAQTKGIYLLYIVTDKEKVTKRIVLQ